MVTSSETTGSVVTTAIIGLTGMVYVLVNWPLLGYCCGQPSKAIMCFIDFRSHKHSAT